MVGRFFSGRHPGDGETMMLLSGPPGSGKTSLLFQFAFNCALGNRGDVVFICNRRRMETKPPCLSQGIDPTSEVFQRIRMKYIEDDEGIKQYFAAFHLSILFRRQSCQDRYGNQRGRDIAMVRTLSLGWDAVSHANKSSAEPCKILLADTHQGDNPRLLFIYKRETFFRKREGGEYSIALQYLVLQRMIDD
ncbi:unnamed protein product [Spirodela intermedia]|uniref:Uncharacterized protein n=1 Tax=Spirodela intermedia TaxID=51605 RepID=A0A7I8IQG9_SPIIN|nr:unnamed protein product [Spirodela intermedia]CAA6660043.1 unnamed protein product [Spirodela intermedia]